MNHHIVAASILSVFILGCASKIHKVASESQPKEYYGYTIGDTIQVSGVFLQEYCPNAAKTRTLCFDGIEQIHRPCPLTIKSDIPTDGQALYQAYLDGVYLFDNHPLNLNCDSLNKNLTLLYSDVDTVRITEKMPGFNIRRQERDLDIDLRYLRFSSSFSAIYTGLKPIIIPNLTLSKRDDNQVPLDSVHVFKIISKA